jgi:hypothetical protein
MNSASISMLLLMLLLFCVTGMEHAPDVAPAINRAADWCTHGTITKTTGECICAGHKGYFCMDSTSSSQSGITGTSSAISSHGCESGYGISFFNYKCLTCKCEKLKKQELSEEWQERRKAAKTGLKKSRSLE